MAGNNDMTMGKLITAFLHQVQQQGFSITLLVIATFYFHVQNTKLQLKVDACVNTQIETYQTRLNFLETVIQENTRALDRNSAALRRMDKE